ncbi:hypothetical protein C8F01DRAFT_973102 [Mycena amicta]|nr:hypothetical protein C8F01DRAFT_973102 [Mycena amicta]
MEGPVAQLPPVPRLRLSRQPLASVADRNESRPQDDDDTQPTPIASEPADRLRALLARIPKPATRPMSPSDLDSDFEPPRFSPTQPKETLKDMFSRLLDDTPNKRTRRGSTSEVDDAPSEERTAKRKGKRKSLSDEEAELSSAPRHTTRSARSSTTRKQHCSSSQRHPRFTTVRLSLFAKTQRVAQSSEASNADESGDTATFLRGLNPLTAVEPVATSTPPHSLEISQNSKFQTNLMDHDSEMNHFIKDLDSYEGDSGPSSRPCK